jgi:hypothetical protein
VHVAKVCGVCIVVSYMYISELWISIAEMRSSDDLQGRSSSRQIPLSNVLLSAETKFSLVTRATNVGTFIFVAEMTCTGQDSTQPSAMYLLRSIPSNHIIQAIPPNSLPPVQANVEIFSPVCSSRGKVHTG